VRADWVTATYVRRLERAVRAQLSWEPNQSPRRRANPEVLYSAVSPCPTPMLHSSWLCPINGTKLFVAVQREVVTAAAQAGNTASLACRVAPAQHRASGALASRTRVTNLVLYQAVPWQQYVETGRGRAQPLGRRVLAAGTESQSVAQWAPC
jgi:hypothetical protein